MLEFTIRLKSFRDIAISRKKSKGKEVRISQRKLKFTTFITQQQSFSSVQENKKSTIN